MELSKAVYTKIYLFLQENNFYNIVVLGKKKLCLYHIINRDLI